MCQMYQRNSCHMVVTCVSPTSCQPQLVHSLFWVYVLCATSNLNPQLSGNDGYIHLLIWLQLVQGLLSSLGVPGGPTQVGVQIGTTTTSGPMPTPGAQQPPPEPTHLLRSIDTFLRHLEQAPTSVQPMHVTSLAPRSSEGIKTLAAIHSRHCAACDLQQCGNPSAQFRCCCVPFCAVHA